MEADDKKEFHNVAEYEETWNTRLHELGIEQSFLLPYGRFAWWVPFKNVKYMSKHFTPMEIDDGVVAGQLLPCKKLATWDSTASHRASASSSKPPRPTDPSRRRHTVFKICGPNSMDHFTLRVLLRPSSSAFKRSGSPSGRPPSSRSCCSGTCLARPSIPTP